MVADNISSKNQRTCTFRLEVFDAAVVEELPCIFLFVYPAVSIIERIGKHPRPVIVMLSRGLDGMKPKYFIYIKINKLMLHKFHTIKHSDGNKTKIFFLTRYQGEHSSTDGPFFYIKNNIAITLCAHILMMEIRSLYMIS